MKKTKKRCNIYNIGSKIVLNPIQIAKIIYKICRTDPNIEIKNISSQEIKFQKLNYKRAINDLKWKPKISMKKGMEITVRWYKENYKDLIG